MSLTAPILEYNRFMVRMFRSVARLAALAGLCLAQDDVLAKLYTEARAAEAANDYRSATERYERIVALRPQMAEAHANLGNLYYVQGRLDLAAVSFQKAIRLKTSLAAPQFLLGVIAFNGRDLEAARRYLDKAATLDPSNPLIWLHLGYVEYARSNYGEAVDYRQKVIAADDANQDARYHLSKSYSQLSKRYFEELRMKHPDSFFTDLARSHFLEAAGSWERAKEDLTRASSKLPEDTGRRGDAVSVRGGEWENGRVSQALRERIEWLTRRPGDEKAAPPAGDEFLDGSTRYLHSAPGGIAVRQAYEAERTRAAIPNGGVHEPRRLYSAAEAYQALSFLSSLWILQTNPDSYREHQLHAQSLEAAGKMEDAIATYQRALALKPDLQTLHFAIGNLYWRRARMEDARLELEKELKVSPNDPQAHYELGDILFTGNHPEAAKKHFLVALKFAPAVYEAHLALERMASAVGANDRALLHLQRAAAIAPDESTPYYRLWLLYRKLGKTTEAQKERETFESLKRQGGGPEADK